MKTDRTGSRAGARPHPDESPNPSTYPALEGVVREVARLFHCLRSVAEAVHQQGQLSGARREVLRNLEREGAQTVPQMARARSYSRQHAQMLVNALLKEGYVELQANPAHRRSPLVQVTAAGRARLAEMVRREQRLWGSVTTGLSPRQLATAERTLRALRETFEGEAWQGAVVRGLGARRRARAPRPPKKPSKGDAS